jgi:NADPH:quinone reductase-like Zn-dependent oxidoreductase
MPALQLTGFGEPAEVVTLVSQPALVARRDEIVVALEAATVHPSDINLIRGVYGVRPRLPAPLGAEGVGKVVEVGRGADQALLGHRVAILPTYEQGTWADHALVATRNIVAVSDEGDPLQLAMIGVNPITALLLLRLFGPVSEGDWVAQTGANSAVGQYIIGLAERAGIHTLNVVRSHEAAAQVSDAGGEHVVIDGDDLPAQVQRVLGGRELALVLDSIGGPVVTKLATPASVRGQGRELRRAQRPADGARSPPGPDLPERQPPRLLDVQLAQAGAARRSHRGMRCLRSVVPARDGLFEVDRLGEAPHGVEGAVLARQATYPLARHAPLRRQPVGIRGALGSPARA